MDRVVLTGGPGTGKTTLLTELARRGHATVDESARAIIAGRRARGLPPRPDPLSFAREILARDIDKYRHPPANTGLVFHDRCALEALAMLHEASPLTDDALRAQLAELRFHGTVFILPPWEAIYVNDAERDHPFAHAVAVHAQLLRWYRGCGYQVCEVPCLPVAQRADHIEQAVARS